MKLNPIGANQTEVLNNDVQILFSYKTPVACLKRNEAGKLEPFRTSQKWSRTTSKHINNWLGNLVAMEKPQSFFDDLIK